VITSYNQYICLYRQQKIAVRQKRTTKNGETDGARQRKQGSDTRVHTQKNPVGFFWVDPPKKTANKTHQKNPPQPKSDFVLCATNKEAFYRFKCFWPMNTEFIFLQLL